MARLFTASTTYAENASAPVTATPITLSAWVNPTAVAAIGSPTWIFRIGNHTSYDQGFALQQAEASGFFRYRIHAGASIAEPFQSGFTAGAWQHIAGVSTSATNHTCYRNGVAGSAVSTSVTPTGVNYTSVGRLDALGGVDYFNGAIGECAAWNVALTAGEIAALAAGVPASLIRPESLVFYDPIYGQDSPEPDLTSGHRNLTVTGSPALAAHPPVHPFILGPRVYALTQQSVPTPSVPPIGNAPFSSTWLRSTSQFIKQDSTGAGPAAWTDWLFGEAVASEVFGATASTWTFTKSVSGTRTRFGATASTFTFGKAVSGSRVALGSASSTWTFGATTAGIRTRFGASASAYTFGKAVAGSATKAGAAASTYTFVKAVAGFATKAGSTTSTWTFGKSVAGARQTLGATASTWTFTATTAGVRTRLGATSSTWTFGKSVAGFATKTGTSASTYTFGKSVVGFATKAGATTSTWTFGKAVAGARATFGATFSSWTFGATTLGRKTTFGVAALPIVFSATTNGTVAGGPATHFGATASTYTFGKAVAGAKTTFGASSLTITRGVTTAGAKTTFGSSALPITFGATTEAILTAFGVVAAPLSLTATTNGTRARFGAASLPITFGAQVAGDFSTPPDFPPAGPLMALAAHLVVGAIPVPLAGAGVRAEVSPFPISADLDRPLVGAGLAAGAHRADLED